MAAPVLLREALAFSIEEIPGALAEVVRDSLDDRCLEEAAILSTCNRVEVYGVANHRGVHRRVARFLCDYHDVDVGAFSEAPYTFHGDEVAHRLAATAAGLHLLIPGESQIQGQVRGALDVARLACPAGQELRRLFEAAIATSRPVRAQTAIGRSLTNSAQAAVALARQRLGDLQARTVLLIGTGAQ